MIVFLSILIITGQIIFTIGVFLKSLFTMILGRAIFGIGNESFITIQNKITSENFKQNQLSTALSIFNACGRLGTVLTFFITPLIAKYFSSTIASIISILLLLGLFVTCLVLSGMCYDDLPLLCKQKKVQLCKVFLKGERKKKICFPKVCYKQCESIHIIKKYSAHKCHT